MWPVLDPPHQELHRGLALQACRQRRSTTCSPSRPPTSSTAPASSPRCSVTAADREDIARPDARRRARGRRDDPRDRPSGSTRTFVTPFDREDIYALASGLDDVMDFMEEAVDLTLLYEVDELPARAGRPGRGTPALRRADRRGDAAAADDEGPRGVLDRDQPAREPGDKSYRRILAKLFSGKYEALEVLKLKDIVDSLEARDRRLREGREHRRADRRQGVLSGGPRDRHRGGRRRPRASTTPTASTTPPTRSPPRSRPAR